MTRREKRRGRHRQAVLNAITDGHIYGYHICKATGTLAGAVYPAMAELERDGLIVGEFETGDFPRRRRYRLTESGVV